MWHEGWVLRVYFIMFIVEGLRTVGFKAPPCPRRGRNKQSVYAEESFAAASCGNYLNHSKRSQQQLHVWQRMKLFLLLSFRSESQGACYRTEVA